ncbi:MAG: DUF45 domain-containing protein [Clostridiales bacterium]|nr:DUF45 domain-containing protein [Clostridiales bacterium]
MRVQVERTLKNVIKMRYEDGVLKVVANCFVSNRKLRQIIEQNADWIRQRKQEAVATHAEARNSAEEPVKHEKKRTTRSGTSGKESSLKGDIFNGRKTVIMGDVISVASSVSAKTYLDGNVLYINEKYCQSREARLKAIKNYLKKIAQLYVSVEIANFGSNVSLCPAKIEFRDVGQSWLKCSMAAQRVLCFDFRIVQLPQNLRMYLIAHAFAHFTHPIHDDKFWNFISNALPHWQDSLKQLEKYNFLKDI